MILAPKLSETFRYIWDRPRFRLASPISEYELTRFRVIYGEASCTKDNESVRFPLSRLLPQLDGERALARTVAILDVHLRPELVFGFVVSAHEGEFLPCPSIVFSATSTRLDDAIARHEVPRSLHARIPLFPAPTKAYFEDGASAYDCRKSPTKFFRNEVSNTTSVAVATKDFVLRPALFPPA